MVRHVAGCHHAALEQTSPTVGYYYSIIIVTPQCDTSSCVLSEKAANAGSRQWSCSAALRLSTDSSCTPPAHEPHSHGRHILFHNTW